MDTPVKKITLLSLAVPILIEQVLRNLMGTVNVFMLGSYSDSAVASVGVANQLINVVIIAFMMIASGTAVLVNHELGAKRYKEAAIISMNALTIAIGLGIICGSAIFFLAPALIRLLGLAAELAPDAVSYLRTMGIAAIFIACSTMLSAVFRCYGNAKIPLSAAILNNCLNIAGTYLVIFRPFEIPLHGVMGVAIMRIISEAFGLVLQLILLLRAKLDFRIADMVRIRFHYIKRIVGIGLMSGMEGISYTLGQVLTTGFITAFGAVALSTKVYVQNVDYYAFIIGLSIGQATQIMVGHKIGAGDLEGAYYYVRKNWRYVLLCNAIFGILMFVFSPQLMSIFTQDPEIIALARWLFLIDAFIHIGRSFNHAYNFGLRSAGYVFWPMIIAIFSIWLCNVGLGYIFSVSLGLSVIGLWLGQMIDEWVRGICVMILWMKKKWIAPIKNRLPL